MTKIIKRKNREGNLKKLKVKTDKKIIKRKKNGGIICEVCDKKVRSRYYLQIHMAVHTGEKNYICGICENGYQQKWNLITHMARVHSKEKPFRCNDCGKAFGYSSHFKRHVKTHFLEKIEAPETVKKRILNPYKCDVCEKCFESNYKLGLHMRIHTGNRPFICEKCGKSFTGKRLCIMHMKKVHSKNFEYICEHCGQSFTHRSSIILHLKTGHSLGYESENKTFKNSCRWQNVTDRNFDESTPKKQVVPCEVCGKTIARASMNKHLNIHYRNRIYLCRYCDKEFLESGQRVVHERSHTGEKPYLCDICGRGHAQYGNLLTHRKRYHNLTTKSSKLWKRNAEHMRQTSGSGFTSSSFLELEKPQKINENVTLINSEYIHADSNKKSDLDKNEANIVNKSSLYSEKAKCTGNETIEDFLKIASKWVNQKFEESKRKNSKSKNVKNAENGVHSSESPSELKSELVNDYFRSAVEVEYSNETNTSTNELVNLKNETESEDSSVKKIKSEMNRIIFEKIVENLSDADVKMVEVVDAIEKKRQQKSFDVLKEFLKAMKSVPDNAVMKKKNGKTFWHCWICESTLRSRHLLARHLLIHQPEEKRPYRCRYCAKSFTQSNNCKEHIMSHQQENQYYCEKCGNGFRHKSHFNMHMRRHDPLPNTQTFKKHECGYCGKQLKTNYQKTEHERIHTKEKPHLCKTCGQQFAALSTLNRHLSTHMNATHQCPVCLKLFRQKSSLKRHLGTHSEYPYNRISCECGKTFSQSPSLTKHKLICKNREQPVVKPFTCIVCEKKFLTKSDLKRHLATHDSAKKFKCTVCSMYLKTRETFNRHIKRHEETKISVDQVSVPP